MSRTTEEMFKTLKILRKLRTYQLARMPHFMDGLKGDCPEMRAAFGLEVILAPLGLLSWLPEMLEEIPVECFPADQKRNDRPTLKEAMALQNDLKAFLWKEEIVNDAGMKTLRDGSIKWLENLIHSLGDAEISLLPYSTHDHLDLMAWRITAVLDLIDFIRSTGVSKNEEKRFRELIAACSEIMKKRFGELSTFLCEETLAGWYATPKATKELLEKLSSRLKREEALLTWIRSDANIKATVLLSTRAVMTLVVVGKAVVDAGGNEEFAQASQSLKDTIELMSGNPEFTRFLSSVGRELKEKADALNEADFDTLAHYGALLCLGTAEGLLDREIAGGDTMLREWLTLIDRNQEKILAQGIRDETAGLGNAWYLKPTRFVSSTDWEELRELQRRNPDFLTSEEGLQLEENGKAFPYSQALPLFVRGLSHLSFEMRRRYLQERKERPQVWKMEWAEYYNRECSWIDTVDRLLERFVGVMLKSHLDGKEMFCHSVGEEGNLVEDLSITAAVADAMSLYAAGHMLTALIEKDPLDETEKTTKKVSQEVRGGDEDVEAVRRFLETLRKHSAASSAIPPSDDAAEEEQRREDRLWLQMFTRIARLNSRLEPSSNPLTWEQLCKVASGFSDVAGYNPEQWKDLEHLFRTKLTLDNLSALQKFTSIMEEVKGRQRKPPGSLGTQKAEEHLARARKKGEAN